MGGSQSTRTVTFTDPNLDNESQDALQKMPAGGGQVLGGGSNYMFVDQSAIEKIKQQLDKEYRTRILDMSEHNLSVTAEQFARAVEDVESKFVKTSSPPVCQDLQEKVLKCYQHNLRQPLNCSREAREFSAAVERERRNALIASRQKSS